MAFLFNAFREGGFFMFVILAFGLGVISLIVERYRFLYLNYVSTPEGFLPQVKKLIQQGDLKMAAMAGEQLKSPLGEIVTLGCKLRLEGASDEVLQARMDERLSQNIHKIDQRTGFLAMLGNVATLAGLLGTIVGMIHSFAAVAKATPMDRATLLSAGISEAMNCTAFGLVVAIPALVAYAFLQNKTESIINETTDLTTEIYHDLLFQYDMADMPKNIGQKSALVAQNTLSI